MDELKKELFDGLKARFAEIENADAENVEALKNKTLDEMRAAIAKIEAVEAFDYYVSLAEKQQKNVEEAVVQLAYMFWGWEEYIEICVEIARDNDLGFSIPEEENAGMNALYEAIKPFMEAYDKNRREDEGIPF
jgi:hypothetical protein